VTKEYVIIANEFCDMSHNAMINMINTFAEVDTRMDIALITDAEYDKISIYSKKDIPKVKSSVTAIETFVAKLRAAKGKTGMQNDKTTKCNKKILDDSKLLTDECLI
jgi:nicotinamide mononucleotide adenylyltransferase